MNNNLMRAILAIAATTILGGCASQSRTEAEFGDSVRNVTMNQIHNKGAAVYSNSDAVTGGDPYRLENVVNTHRGDVPQQQQYELDSPVDIRSGNR